VSAPEVLYDYLGSPAVEGSAPLAEPARCWLCTGGVKAGMPVRKWIGPAFTAHNRARAPSSSVICAGCIFLCGRLSPVPGRPPKEGKTTAGNWRNYSHWMIEDADGAWTYGNASKGEKPRILEALRSRKHGRWWMAVADSGQKHVIPWAPINGRAQAGVVIFDEEIATVPSTLDLVDEMASLLTGGATKDELDSGDWTPRAWSLLGPRLEDFEDRHEGKRGSPWFRLAIWLAQRDEAAVMARLQAEKEKREHDRAEAKRRTGAPIRDREDRALQVTGGEARATPLAVEVRGPDRRGAPAVPLERREADDELGGSRRPVAARSPHDRIDGGPRRSVVPRPSDPAPRQLDLFGAPLVP
jgi:hypothetical protein